MQAPPEMPHMQEAAAGVFALREPVRRMEQ